MTSIVALGVALGAALTACMPKSDEQFQAEIAAKMHKSIDDDLLLLKKAAGDLQTAAPSTAWKLPDHDRALGRMRTAWTSMRIAWENVEGAMAPMFPGLNIRLDARYEEFLLGLGPTGDPNPFDAIGVVGMHAVERILYAPVIRPEVIARESSLPGYGEPRYPSTDNEAIAFKTQLLQRLVDDVSTMQKEWRPDEVDIGGAYQGLVDLMLEQREKVNLAVTGEEESRYANITLLDLRHNVGGTQKYYELFRDWILSKSSAESSDQQVRYRLTKLGDTYETYRVTDGDSLPQVPEGWSSANPSPDNLRTPFGALWLQIHESVDPDNDGSVVYVMNQVATLLGFPQVVE